MIVRRFFGTVLCLVLVSSCGSPNRLDGSIGQSFDLEFDYVQVRKQGEALIIEYIKEVTGGQSKLLKIVVDGRRLVDASGAPIAMEDGLSIDDDLFARAVTVDRVASTGANFPPITNGRLQFFVLEFLADGRCEGNFDILFENGRNLSGAFMGRLEPVDLS